MGDGGGSTPNFFVLSKDDICFSSTWSFSREICEVVKKKKNLGWATVWRMVHNMTAKRMRSNWAPWRREFLQLYIYFPIFATTIQIYVSTKDYENMFTLGCHYTFAIKLTTRLLRHSLWPCNLHSTWERKNTLHSYNTSKHICSCSRNSVDNTKLLCNYKIYFKRTNRENMPKYITSLHVAFNTLETK